MQGMGKKKDLAQNIQPSQWKKNLPQHKSIAQAASLFALPNWGLCYEI